MPQRQRSYLAVATPVTPGSLEAPIAALPVLPNPLIGRERELATAQALLREPAVRLLTLSGPGGVGKTRLAVEVARSLAAEFSDGINFVPLAGVSDSDSVAPAIAWAMGFREVGDRPATAHLADELPHRNALLVLDNFEQVDAAAPLLAMLLGAGSGLKLMVTSRSPLHLAAEHLFPIPPLAFPDPDRLPRLPELAEVPAVALFAERARAATGDFSLSAENALAVAAICRRLDGLPLAIELTAAWTRLLSPTALLERLSSRLLELAGGPRDAPSRHQTIRDTIAWSHDLLTREEREFFARLGVFAGGWTIEAAEAISEDPPFDVLRNLARLVDQSLVKVVRGSSEESRFDMLETIREYAREQQALDNLKDVTDRRHTSHFLELAENAQLSLGGPDEVRWLARLRADYDNLRAVIERALNARDATTALRLGVFLWRFWAQRGHLVEGRGYLERALSISGDVDAAVRVRAMVCLGNLALDLSDLSEARGFFTESLSLWRELADQDGIASALNGLGLVARDLGELTQARQHFSEALSIWSALDDAPGVALILHNLGTVATADADYGEARAYHEEALAIRRRLDDTGSIAYSLWGLATTTRLSGETTTAKNLYGESRTHFRELGDRQGEALATYGLARIAQQMGDDSDALRLFREALSLSSSLAERIGMVECIEGIAAVMAQRGYAEHAVRLLGATASVRAVVATIRTEIERREPEQTLTMARRVLTNSAFDAAWAAGQALSLEAATEEALTLTGQSSVLTRPASPFNLTRREQEVLALLAEHLTDSEIAQRLYLSPRTASNHVASILGKLGVSSRREAAAFATRHGLV
jgi:predicted ATPase/DNA-binding NarL/FixJ family response regulator